MSFLCSAALLKGHSKLVSKNYFSTPTGQYHVGVKDFHWINQNRCSDFMGNDKNLLSDSR